MTLTKLLHDYLGRAPRRNPPTAELSSFLRDLSAAHELDGWTEADWVDAGRSVGLSDDEITEWMEEAAGWVADTTDHPDGMEPAAWAS
jgi:hypothetical protein